MGDNLIEITHDDVSRLLDVKKAKWLALLEPSKYLFHHISMIKECIFLILLAFVSVVCVWNVDLHSSSTLQSVVGVTVAFAIASFVISLIWFITSDGKSDLWLSAWSGLICVILSGIGFFIDKQALLYSATTKVDTVLGVLIVISILLTIAAFIWICTDIYEIINKKFELNDIPFSISDRHLLGFNVPDSIVAELDAAIAEYSKKDNQEYTAHAFLISNKFKSASNDIVYAIVSGKTRYLIGIGPNNRKPKNAEKTTEKRNNLSNAEVNAIRASMKRMREE